MKEKTIKAVLSKKFNEFVESIQDEKVKDLVKNNSIITGGCIASMFLQEKVNDYDIYFTDYETVQAVAEYYVDKFIELNPDKLHPELVFIDDGEEKRAKIKLQSQGIGSETNDHEKAYEYFENTNGDQTIDYVEQLNQKINNDKKPKFRPVFMSSNAITLSDDIQLVIRFYGDAKEIHSNFDFIHCMNLWVSKDKQLMLNKDSLTSLLTKELRYHGSKYPLASLIRMRKFVQRQWTINAGQILKMAMQLNELDLKDINVLEDQLSGVDFAYFVELIEIIKEKKDKDITTSYIVEIINRMF